MSAANDRTLPLRPAHLATSVRLGDVQIVGPYVVWHESVGGRGSLFCADTRTADAPIEVTPPELSVRARVGYGGGDFAVTPAWIFFVAAQSGQIYRQPLTGGAAMPITPPFGNAAAPTPAPNGRWLAYVHSDGRDDCVALVDVAGTQWPQKLISGHDFYMQPAWNPASNHLAVVAWNHPNMPWDGTELLLAQLDLRTAHATPALERTLTLAGDPQTAIFQPSFSPDGRMLAYVSDASGWGQIMLYDLATQTHRALTSAAAEHAEPAWAQGARTLAWSHDSAQIYSLRNQDAQRTLVAYNVTTGAAHPLPATHHYTWLSQISASGSALACIAATPTQPAHVITLALPDADTTRIVRRSAPPPVPASALAQPQAIQWTSADGTVLHAICYQPPTAAIPGTALPPAIIRMHGGPTGQATLDYNAQAQYFATRGYVVLDLNFRGSTGYGRSYMQALVGGWGSIDLADTLSAADYLAAAGLADPQRLVIMGGSSGGYAVLQALCHAPGRFRAGICLYGVSDLFLLAAETHKFEAHYTDTLVGALPQAAALYRERSPAFHADQIRDPLAIFHGSDDTVVPPNQADAIVASLRRRNIPHHYRLFAGEGHGFRRPETITTLYGEIETFLQQHVVL